MASQPQQHNTSLPTAQAPVPPVPPIQQASPCVNCARMMLKKPFIICAHGHGQACPSCFVAKCACLRVPRMAQTELATLQTSLATFITWANANPHLIDQSCRADPTLKVKFCGRHRRRGREPAEFKALLQAGEAFREKVRPVKDLSKEIRDLEACTKDLASDIRRLRQEIRVLERTGGTGTDEHQNKMATLQDFILYKGQTEAELRDLR